MVSGLQMEYIQSPLPKSGLFLHVGAESQGAHTTSSSAQARTADKKTTYDDYAAPTVAEIVGSVTSEAAVSSLAQFNRTYVSETNEAALNVCPATNGV